MTDIIHRIGINSPAAHVYSALSTTDGLAHWWTKDVNGDDQVGGKLEFNFRTQSGDLIGKIGMEVEALDAPTKVQWRCVDEPKEWLGTDITFDLSQQDEQTIVLFGHRNWREATEFTSHCSMKWATFLLSLRDYIESGAGRPSPDDVKIDNWN